MSYELREFSSLRELYKGLPDEQAAIDHFTAIRWKNGEFCPYCGGDRLYHFKDNRTHKCADPDCGQRFSIKIGTIFENTKLPLRTWMLAVWFITSHKKGIASTQLAKDLGVTQKTAWFMMHRLRHAARTRSFNRKLGGEGGEVEADELFVGGKDSNRPRTERKLRSKAVVMGILERGGELRAHQIEAKRHVTKEVQKHVAPGAHLMTDDYKPYKNVGPQYVHQTVNHSREEYVRGRVHTNSIEGYWSQLKRQIYGIHHWVSRKHLDRYVTESVWRHNRRALDEAPRFNELLAISDGRLRYTELTA